MIYMSLDQWKQFFEVGFLILMSLTFLFLAGALSINDQIHECHKKELCEYQVLLDQAHQRTKEAQQIAADAQQIAVESQALLRKHLERKS